MKKIAKIIVLWTWCLPQTLLGLFVFLYFMIRGKVKGFHALSGNEICFIEIDQPTFGVSLGYFIILDIRYSPITARHEYGHTIQNYMLGPFYLLLVGIPSICRNIYSRIFHKSAYWYYDGYPENWADDLMNIERTKGL